MPTGLEQSTRLAIIMAVAALVVLNVALYVLSGNYFQAHSGEYTPEQMARVREIFAITCAVLVAVNFVVGLNRRVGAHVLAGLLGLSKLAGGIAAFTHDLPGALVATGLVAGTVMPTLAWFSYRRSRAS